MPALPQRQQQPSAGGGVFANMFPPGSPQWREAESFIRSAQSQSPGNNIGNTRGVDGSTSANTSQGFRMAPGDVILEINGERIGRQEDVTSAIGRAHRYSDRNKGKRFGCFQKNEATHG